MGIARRSDRRVCFNLSLEDYALLLRMSQRSGRTLAEEARAILLDVLHDDAAAHRGEVSDEVA